MKQIARRSLIQKAGAAALVSTLSPEAGAYAAPFKMPSSPAEAMAILSQGNERFGAKRFTSLQEDLEILRSNTLEQQKPFAAILACADSRVPVELVFDQTIGHLFVVRCGKPSNSGDHCQP